MLGGGGVSRICWGGVAVVFWRGIVRVSFRGYLRGPRGLIRVVFWGV